MNKIVKIHPVLIFVFEIKKKKKNISSSRRLASLVRRESLLASRAQNELYSEINEMYNFIIESLPVTSLAIFPQAPPSRQAFRLYIYIWT